MEICVQYKRDGNNVCNNSNGGGVGGGDGDGGLRRDITAGCLSLVMVPVAGSSSLAACSRRVEGVECDIISDIHTLLTDSY